jgi:hypothetical protein
MNTKTLTILAVVAAVAVIAAVVALRSDKAGATGAGATEAKSVASPLPADLASKINDVAAISVKTAGGETNIELVDGQWRLKEKGGYPAAADKVRGVMVGLAGLRNWTEKTSRPELYKTLGVDEPVKKDAAAAPPAGAEAPESAGSQSLLLTLKDKAGQPVTSVIVGNTKWGQGGGGGSQGVYLRKAGDARSYYADGKLEVPREALMWLDNEIANVGRDRVRSVTVTPRENSDADRIVVTAEKPGVGGGGFKVEGIPAGKQLKDAGLSETVVAGLTSAMFEDVSKLDAVDFAGTASAGGGGGPGKPGPAVDVRTWDGLLVHVDTVQVGDKWWWKLSASADPDPFKEGEGDAAKPKRTPEEVKKEVDELNGKWAGWAFAPYSYKSSAYTKKLSEEVKMPDATPAPGAGAPGAGPTGLPPGFPGAPGQPVPVPAAPPAVPQPQP